MRSPIVLCFWLLSVPALADVRHYGVFVGANRGYVDEVPLRFAETDAARLADVLHVLGNLPAENMVMLRGDSAESVRRALVSLNARIRRAVAEGHQAVLFVYYSGHGDAAELHLGNTPLSAEELRGLVLGSPATFRVLVVDACRSGGIIGVKGAVPVPTFAVNLEDQLPSEGFAVVTSASAQEDAQESDRWGGSVFTASLISGLAGAADVSGDGIITLQEAYAYAYEQTLQATLSTVSGPQHPAFSYDLRGKGGFSLTQVGHPTPQLGVVRLRRPGVYFFLDARDERVRGEVRFSDGVRQVHLPPARYRVERRARDHLLAGEVDVQAGATMSIEDSHLRRVAYAQALRKGSIDASMAWSLGFGWQSQGALAPSVPQLGGPVLAVELHAAHLTWGLQAFSGTAERRGDLAGKVTQSSLRAGVAFPFDMGPATLLGGVEGGATVLRETFALSRRIAPVRFGVAPLLGLVLGCDVGLWGPVHLSLRGSLRTYLVREQDSARLPATTHPAWVPTLYAGVTWQWLS